MDSEQTKCEECPAFECKDAYQARTGDTHWPRGVHDGVCHSERMLCAATSSGWCFSAPIVEYTVADTLQPGMADG